MSPRPHTFYTRLVARLALPGLARRDRLLANPVFNRVGLHIFRKRLAGLIASTYRLRTGWLLPRAERRAFDQQGFVALPDFLPADTLARVKAELLSEAWPMLEMGQPPANTIRSNLDTALCGQRCPAVRELIGHVRLGRWMRYAAGYGGTPIISLQIIRTDGVAAGHDPQTDWHSDTYHSLSKAWLFLHDVPADQGPFGYVPGTHRPTPAHWAWEYQQSISAAAADNPMHAKGSFRITPEALAAIGYGQPYVAAVPGNTLVVADTSGFHRRTPSPQPTVRIEIYLTLRRQPFLAGLLPDLLGLPVVRSRWAGWAYRYFEWLIVQGTHGWLPKGQRTLQGDEAALLRGESPAPAAPVSQDAPPVNPSA